MDWFCWIVESFAGSGDGSRNRCGNRERCGVGYVNNNSSTINFIFILPTMDLQMDEGRKRRKCGRRFKVRKGKWNGIT